MGENLVPDQRPVHIHVICFVAELGGVADRQFIQAGSWRVHRDGYLFTAPVEAGHVATAGIPRPLGRNDRSGQGPLLGLQDGNGRRRRREGDIVDIKVAPVMPDLNGVFSLVQRYRPKVSHGEGG